jgi:hypothetical protein
VETDLAGQVGRRASSGHFRLARADAKHYGKRHRQFPVHKHDYARLRPLTGSLPVFQLAARSNERGINLAGTADHSAHHTQL